MKGFTLIEAMIAVTILTISLLGVVAMQVYFGTQTTDQSLKNCLVDSSMNALSQYKGNSLPITSSVTCDIYTITVSLDQSTFPSSDNCSDVTATSSSMGKSFSIKTKVCNFQ